MSTLYSTLLIAARAVEARAEARAKRLARRSIGYAAVGFAAAAGLVYGSVALFLYASSVYDPAVAALMTAAAWVLFAALCLIAIIALDKLETRRGAGRGAADSAELSRALLQAEATLREQNPALAAAAGVAAGFIASRMRK